MTISSVGARTRSGHIKRSRHPGCSLQMARPSPERTDATTCPPVRWSAWRFLPGPAKGEPESAWTWRRPVSNRATSWSRLTRTPAGHPLRRDHGPGDRGRGPDDPWRSDRTGIRPAGRRRVEHATQLIQDGQRIRVNGTDGYIEILPAT